MQHLARAQPGIRRGARHQVHHVPASWLGQAQGQCQRRRAGAVAAHKHYQRLALPHQLAMRQAVGPHCYAIRLVLEGANGGCWRLRQAAPAQRLHSDPVQVSSPGAAHPIPLLPLTPHPTSARMSTSTGSVRLNAVSASCACSAGTSAAPSESGLVMKPSCLRPGAAGYGIRGVVGGSEGRERMPGFVPAE